MNIYPWICPKCKSVYGPSSTECYRCNNNLTEKNPYIPYQIACSICKKAACICPTLGKPYRCEAASRGGCNCSGRCFGFSLTGWLN